MTATEEHDMEELQGASYLFRKPQEIQVKVENDIFYIHKALLIKDSESFKELLSTPLNKGETQIIKIEGMKSKEFDVYLDFVYRGYTGMGLHRPHHAANYKYTEDMVRLLKCSARFENKKLLAIADDSIALYLSRFTPGEWEASCKQNKEEYTRNRACVLEKLALMCMAEGLSHYYDQYAEAYANMPDKVFAQQVTYLKEISFCNLVSSKSANRRAIAASPTEGISPSSNVLKKVEKVTSKKRKRKS